MTVIEPWKEGEPAIYWSELRIFTLRLCRNEELVEDQAELAVNECYHESIGIVDDAINKMMLA